MVDQMEVSQQDRSSGKFLSRGPGIAVLSPSLQVLYMDRQAQILISDFVPTTPEAQRSNACSSSGTDHSGGCHPQRASKLL